MELVVLGGVGKVGPSLSNIWSKVWAISLIPEALSSSDEESPDKVGGIAVEVGTVGGR